MRQIVELIRLNHRVRQCAIWVRIARGAALQVYWPRVVRGVAAKKDGAVCQNQSGTDRHSVASRAAAGDAFSVDHRPLGPTADADAKLDSVDFNILLFCVVDDVVVVFGRKPVGL